MSMKTEVSVSKSSYDADGGRLLAQTCINLAISQVKAATMEAAENSYAWASQPGMIRLYDNTGSPHGYRKLYSADKMVGTGAFNSSQSNSDDPVSSTWSNDPCIWTDLNAPVSTTLPDGTLQSVFPIVNPSAIDTNPMEGQVSPVSAIDQFTVSGAPVDHGPNTVPMPVKWLYVLQDGKMQTATGNGTHAVVSGATAANPIVGRIAFWADDDSCKVNINTASDGTFWDTPRFNTNAEQKFAGYQPARGEYQRYPGHPAMVCLKSLFPNLTSQQIFSLVPRLSYGGSMGATVGVKDITAALVPDKDRLYSSVDEILFSQQLSSSSDRVANIGLSKDQIQNASFFLTAASRAPELNLYGKPRVCIWPEYETADKNYRTAIDRLIAFCSTVGSGPSARPFYFTRRSSMLVGDDISLPRNTALLDYLDTLTGMAIPGFGGSFSAKYTQGETRQILTEIFDYIRCTNLFDTTTPSVGTGANMRFPYAYALSPNLASTPGSRNHISGGNLSVAVPAYKGDWGTGGFGGHFMQVAEASIWFVGLGKGKDYSVTPPANAIPIFTEQIGTRLGMDTAADPTNNTPPSGKTAVQAYLLLSFLTPGQGVTSWCPGTWVEISGLEQFGIKLNPSDSAFTPLGFPSAAKAYMNLNWMGSHMGGIGGLLSYLDIRGMLRTGNSGKVLGQADPANQFPFYSNILAVDNKTLVAPCTVPTMQFQGGEITVKLYADSLTNPGKAPGNLSQTLKISFPDAVNMSTGGVMSVQSFPVPNLGVVRRLGTPGAQVPANPPNLTGSEDRFDLDKGAENGLLDPADTIKSVVINSGDLRLLFRPNSSNTLFRPHPNYLDPGTRMAHGHSFGYACGFAAAGTRSGLIEGAVYDPAKQPYISAGNTLGARTSNGALGDWDNGTSLINDGPYVNAPDEGATGIDPGSGNYTIPYFSNSVGDVGPTYFSPNRQVPSAGMFGSLSTGVRRGLPWQTLLFRPGPSNHPGRGLPAGGPPFTMPPDHLMLDLFWMPVVEPYALSEPFSTAGKINLNQQIVPFTYINRTAGLRAALAAENVAIQPKLNAGTYKRNIGSTLTYTSRLPLNLSDADGTLRQVVKRFNQDGEIFRSASEICDIYFVPQGKHWGSDEVAQNEWYGDDFALVGDNTRERPYANVYPRLTTKSNTFTVHYRAEVLRSPKAKVAIEPTVFDTAKGGEVIASFRGSTTFERYLDPNDPRVSAKDPAANDTPSLESIYRYHVLSTKEFSP